MQILISASGMMMTPLFVLMTMPSFANRNNKKICEFDQIMGLHCIIVFEEPKLSSQDSFTYGPGSLVSYFEFVKKLSHHLLAPSHLV
jgi:hypothetical protein